MKKLLIGLTLISSISAIANETCVYVYRENVGKPHQAFSSCSNDSKGKEMKIINNNGPLSKAKHLAELQEKRGMKLVSCTLAITEKISVSQCLLTKL